MLDRHVVPAMLSADALQDEIQPKEGHFFSLAPAPGAP
jgi:hypothetical protein